MKPLLMIALPIAAVGGALLLNKISQEEYEENKNKLTEILDELKAAYIPIYVHSYNLFLNSVRELKDKPEAEKFIKEQVQQQSIFPGDNFYFSRGQIS
jgi:hypothetical protein